MTEHKFTDEKIIRALEGKAEAHCAVCEIKGIVPCEHCVFHYVKNALDLINRQREEIAVIKETTAEIRYEAVKEFADRLVEYHIDEVVKEMTSSNAPKVVHKDYFTPKEGVNNE